jgi:hypothetical protein
MAERRTPALVQAQAEGGGDEAEGVRVTGMS